MFVFAKVIRRIKAITSVQEDTTGYALSISTAGIVRSLRVNSDVTIGNVYLAIISFSQQHFAISIVGRA